MLPHLFIRESQIWLLIIIVQALIFIIQEVIHQILQIGTF